MPERKRFFTIDVFPKPAAFAQPLQKAMSAYHLFSATSSLHAGYYWRSEPLLCGQPMVIFKTHITNHFLMSPFQMLIKRIMKYSFTRSFHPMAPELKIKSQFQCCCREPILEAGKYKTQILAADILALRFISL